MKTRIATCIGLVVILAAGCRNVITVNNVLTGPAGNVTVPTDGQQGKTVTTDAEASIPATAIP